MFCKNCGSEIPNDSRACQNCGAPTSLDSGNIGYFCLGCCVPVAGIVLYLVWKDQKPQNAKKCLWGFLLYVIFMAIYIAIYVGVFFIAGITGNL